LTWFFADECFHFHRSTSPFMTRGFSQTEKSYLRWMLTVTMKAEKINK
jgi:hypothetical protein